MDEKVTKHSKAKRQERELCPHTVRKMNWGKGQKEPCRIGKGI